MEPSTSEDGKAKSTEQPTTSGSPDAIGAVEKVNLTQQFNAPNDEDSSDDEELPAHLKLLASNPDSKPQPKKAAFSIFDVFNLKKHIPKKKRPPPPPTPDIDDDHISLYSIPINEPISPTYSRAPTPPTPGTVTIHDLLVSE